MKISDPRNPRRDIRPTPAAPKGPPAGRVIHSDTLTRRKVDRAERADSKKARRKIRAVKRQILAFQAPKEEA